MVSRLDLEDETLSASCLSLPLLASPISFLFCHLSSPLSCCMFSNAEAMDSLRYPVRVPPGPPSHGHRRMARFIDNMRTSVWGYDPSKVCVCVFVFLCFLPILSGDKVRWTYQPGSHRKVTQDFSSTFLLRCVSQFFSREGFSHSFPSSTVKSNVVY